MPENTIQQDPGCRKFVSNPYSHYAQWHARSSPIFWKHYGFWCILGFDAVNRVLRDRRFARLPPPGQAPAATPPHLRDFAAAEEYSLLSMEPPEHTRLRKLVNRAFVSRHINTMAPLIRTTANACVDKFLTCHATELLQHYATPVPVTVITRLLGVPVDAGEQLVAWSHAMVKVYTLTQTLEEEIAANQAAAEFQLFLSEVLASKRHQPGDDLLSQLLYLQAQGESLSDEEIISVTILLLNAGHEATVHQLGNAVYTLLRHYPATQRSVLVDALADDTSADAIVSECLRYAAPLHLFTRYAQEDVTLHDGVTLLRGDQIGLLLAAANRCPKRFVHPDTFMPERTDAAHLSLGAGIHFCLGAQLAHMELRIALQVLFERLPALELAKTPVYQDAYHFHGLQALHVRW